MSQKFNLINSIIRTKLENSDNYSNSSSPVFQTSDKVFLYSYTEFAKKGRMSAIPTDYAKMCGASFNKNGYAWKWGRSSLNKGSICGVAADNDVVNFTVDTPYVTACPVINVDLNFFKEALSKQQININNNKLNFKTVNLGQFPQSKVDKEGCDKLNYLKNCGMLLTTGNQYTGFLNSECKLVRNLEYEYNGNKYVSVELCPENDDLVGYNVRNGEKTKKFDWAKVEPISFKIVNWDDLPTDINPSGSGEAKTVELESEKGIISGIPFNTDCTNPYSDLWQNSILRAYLNGYNNYIQISNGNGLYYFRTSVNIDCTDHGFLQEALSQQPNVNIKNKPHEKKKKVANPYGFNFEALDNDQLLEKYVKARVPVLLHGQSGVGKSSVVYDLDKTATRITLKPMQNPEEIYGVLDREKNEYKPPVWYTQLCKKCEKDKNKIHILFIDELMNVKPSIQSLVYDIVLDRSSNGGMWKLPENCEVVAAGNESQNNLAAYPLTNALFRRFCHIYYNVDKQRWLDWATSTTKSYKQKFNVQQQKLPKSKIHPAIVSYISSRDKDVLYQELDEENPKIVTDPRKWEIASKILYSTKNPNSLLPAIGETLTIDFINFVRKSHLTVDDILKGNYDENELKNIDISETMSIVGGLTMAKEQDLPVVRKFIGKIFGKEILASFDAMWISNKPKRAEIIAEEQEESQI